MANEWSKLVGKVYRENKHKAGYKLQNAMKDAKKFYKKVTPSHTAHKRRSRGASRKRRTRKHR
jgi:hypothetical protein